MTEPSTAEQAHSDVEQAVVAALDDADGFPDWTDLTAAVGDDVTDDELDEAVKTLQSEGVLQYSGRDGGYVLVDTERDA